MKNNKKYIMLFFTVFTFFFAVEGVLAAPKKMAICKYKGNNGKDVVIKEIGGGKKIPLTISVNDDGSVELPVSGGDSLDSTMGIFWYVDKKAFSKNGSYYKAAYNSSTKKYSCPKIQLIYHISSSQLGMYAAIDNSRVEGEGDTTYEVSAKVELTENATNSGGSASKRTLICERPKPVILDNQDTIIIEFYKEDNKKKFSISYKSNPDRKSSANADQIASLGQHSYRIKDTDVDTYFSSTKKCKSAPLFLHRTTVGSVGQSMMTLQIEKPDNVENGAYTPNDAEKDDGSDNNPLIDYMPSSSLAPNISGSFSEDTCELINSSTATFQFLKKIINYIKIGTIFLVLVLGMVDLAGAVGSSEEGSFKKAGTKFGKRLIAAALVFLVPAIVEILIALVNDASCKTNTHLKDLYN